MTEIFDRVWIKKGQLPVGVASSEQSAFAHGVIGNTSMGDEIIEYVRAEINENKIDELVKALEKLSALEEAGVDSWEGYDDAMKTLRENKS